MVTRSQLIPAEISDIQEGNTLYIINPYHPDLIIEHKVSFRLISVKEIKELYPYEKHPDKYIKAYVQEFVEYLEQGRLYVQAKSYEKPKKQSSSKQKVLWR